MYQCKLNHNRKRKKKKDIFDEIAEVTNINSSVVLCILEQL